jgi:hypothetical protein
LQAILSPEEFAGLEKQMGVIKNAQGKMNDINVGSRTAPMLAEQADNALPVSGITSDLMKGNPVSAALRGAGYAMNRMGRLGTEGTNARIAEWMSALDPAKVGLVKAMANRNQLRDALRSSYLSGGVAGPGLNFIERGVPGFSVSGDQ